MNAVPAPPLPTKAQRLDTTRQHLELKLNQNMLFPKQSEWLTIKGAIAAVVQAAYDVGYEEGYEQKRSEANADLRELFEEAQPVKGERDE